MYVNGTCKCLNSQLIGIFIEKLFQKIQFYNCNVLNVKFDFEF